MDGIEATRGSSAEPERRTVLVLTTFDLDEYVFEALRAGASGFLLKDAPPERAARARCATVAAGDALLAPSVTRRLIERVRPPPVAARTRRRALETLTPREREVLGLVARGLSNAEIAERAVRQRGHGQDARRARARKLGLRDRVQAVILAYEAGLVTPGAGTAGG